MAGPKVQFKLTTKANGKFTCPDVEYSSETAKLFKPAYSTGQIIFVEDAAQIFLDFHNKRRGYGSTDTQYLMKYLGVSTTDPATGTVTIDGKVVTPKANDMVAYKTKEFIYRANESGDSRWYELGDEESPEWNANSIDFESDND